MGNEAKRDELEILSLFQCHQLASEEEITFVAGTTTNLFIGTSIGNVLNVKKPSGAIEFQLGSVAPLGNESISKIVHLSALEILMVICGNSLIEISLNEANYFQVIQSQKNVSGVYLNSNPAHDDNNDPFCVHLAVSSGKNIHLFQKKAGRQNSKPYHKITSTEPIRDFVYQGKTICFATSSSYFIHNAVENRTLSLFPIDNPNNAKICALDSEEFVLFTTGLAMIINSKGISTRPPLVFHEQNILSCCLKSANILLLGPLNLAIYECHSAEIDQIFDNSQKWNLITAVEGDILLCNGKDIFKLTQESFTRRVNRLISRGLLEKALEYCEKEFEVSPNDETISLVSDIKKQLAFKMIDECNWISAYEYLLSGNVNPLEILPKFDEEFFISYSSGKNADDDAKYNFLKQYLRDVSKQSFVNQSLKAKIDYCRIQYGIFIDPSKWTVENHLSMAKISKERGGYENLVTAGKHFIVGSQLEQGLREWEDESVKRLINEQILNETIHMLSNNSEVEAIVEFGISNLQTGKIDFVDKCDLLSFEEKSRILKKFPEQFKLWLIRHLNKPELRCQYLLLLCDDVKNTDDERYRACLRAQLLECLHKNWNISPEVREVLRGPHFNLEYRLIEYKPTAKSSQETLNLALRDDDCDSAESFIDLHAEEYPFLLQTLFSYYKSNISKPNYRVRMTKYLKQVKNPAIAMQILNELPDNLEMNEINGALKSVVIHKIDELASLKLAKAAQHFVIKSRSEEKKSTPIFITEHNVCEACNKHLDLQKGAVSYLPSGYVVHTSCIRHPGLCPITNLVFNP